MRAADPELFADGDFVPLPLRGPRAGDAIAFARTLGSRSCLFVAAIRGAAACIEQASPAPSADWWQGTVIAPPDGPEIAAADITNGAAFGWHQAKS